MPLKEVDVLAARFEEAHEAAGQYLFTTEAEQNWGFALGEGGHIEFSHFRQIHHALTSFVVQDGDVIEVCEVVFCLNGLNPGRVAGRIHVFHNQALALMEQDFCHQASYVTEDL